MAITELTLMNNRLTPKRKFVLKRSRNPLTKKYTKAEIVAEIEKSYERAEQGHTKSAYQHLAELKARHGI
ncbi:hypothetical protein IJG27_01175 [Candidatus Saccharibacteria bacterium]|nr:hypothetical protein [Candidatus Saccharibacteria bacterium]